MFRSIARLFQSIIIQSLVIIQTFSCHILLMLSRVFLFLSIFDSQSSFSINSFHSLVSELIK
ncbi:TPA: hypothetical protein DEG21_06285 [Patescibacteria group bacterium]|nr:hypothetical protein [Candidatus Gracilibacteria bacterium]